MSLKDRWKAKPSRIGFILKNILGKGLTAVSLIGECSAQLGVVPPELVPHWLRMTILFCGIVSFVAGGMTTSKSPKDKPKEGA
jgi:hypothetical protein